MTELLYPKDHPYHWPVIGYMEDLTAATHEDVVDFFKKYYAPGNASLVIAGDINPAEVRRKVESLVQRREGRAHRWNRSRVPPAELTGVIKETLDRPGAAAAHLPRVAHAGALQARRRRAGRRERRPGGGKNSRLYKRLVYDMQIAQDVNAAQSSSTAHRRPS